MKPKKALELLQDGPTGVAAWNEWRAREGTDGTPLDLSKVNLSKSDLSGINLGGVNLSGANLSETDLNEADLNGADLSDADLRGAQLVYAKLRRATLLRVNLNGAGLRKTDLREANLRDANLRGANLCKADLKGGWLSGANLSKANLSMADLNEANLSQADLSRANLDGAILSGADLSDADLSGASLSGTNLKAANLSAVDLTLTRLIRTDLTHAKIEAAIIQDVQIQGLVGLPHPASSLWLDVRGSSQLTGADAANFFRLPAVVEVFLTRALSDVELGCLHFHFGEVRARGVAEDVYLVGHRHESGGSVLRFQGPTYATVYTALPHLLAIFRTTQAVDWKTTLTAVPKDERGEAVAALVKAHEGHQQHWELAQRLALMFGVFNTAQIKWLGEGRTRGGRIEVYEDPEAKKELVANPDTKQPPYLVMGPNSQFHFVAGNVIASAIGTAASATAGPVTADIHQSGHRAAGSDDRTD